MSPHLDELAKEASAEAIALATAVLAGDVANRAWRNQVGPRSANATPPASSTERSRRSPKIGASCVCIATTVDPR